MIDRDRENDVLLGFVDNGTVATVFMDSVLKTYSEGARRAGNGEPLRCSEYYFGTGPYIHDNRARVARYFLECTDKQWLWMCDNDMKFPADSLFQLLEAAEEHDCHILGAAYWNQYQHGGRYLSWLVLIPEKGFVAAPELPEDVSVPAEISATGMGCTLIHRSALQAVAERYPNDAWDTFGADTLYRFADGGMMIVRSPDDVDPEAVKDRELSEDPIRLGEDVTFCMRARKAGFLTYGLPTLTVEHFKPHFVECSRRDADDQHLKAHGRSGAGARPDSKEDLAHAAV